MTNVIPLVRTLPAAGLPPVQRIHHCARSPGFTSTVVAMLACACVPAPFVSPAHGVHRSSHSRVRGHRWRGDECDQCMAGRWVARGAAGHPHLHLRVRLSLQRSAGAWRARQAHEGEATPNGERTQISYPYLRIGERFAMPSLLPVRFAWRKSYTIFVQQTCALVRFFVTRKMLNNLMFVWNIDIVLPTHTSRA